MKQDITNIPAVIIAGGKGTRMGGIDKCLLNVGQKTVLTHIVETLSQQTSSIFLNINGDGQRFSEYSLPQIKDQTEEELGPLGGLASTFAFLKNQNNPASNVLTVAGDCPFLPSNLLHTLSAAFTNSEDVIYCYSNNRDHFITALWSREILPQVSAFLDTGGRSVARFINTLAHKRVTFEYEAIDPFFNINTEHQLQQANTLYMGRNA